MASSTLTLVMRPSTSSKPSGWFIQALALTTAKAPPIPVTTMGTPDQKCAQSPSRFQP